MITFTNVSKRYVDGSNSLVDVSFRVPTGSLVAVTGSSVRGPGAVVRLVNRILDPDAGDIVLDGASVAGEDPIVLRRRIGFVTGDVGLFPHLSVLDNVLAVPRLMKVDVRQAKNRAMDLLGLVGLAPADAGRFPNQLGGTEPHRVALARAVAASPKVLLLDEPFAGIEPAPRAEMRALLRAVHRSLDITTVIATHHVDDALALGELLVVLMASGRLAQEDTADELLGRPANEDVRRFLGPGRGIRRLGLVTLADAPLSDGPVVPVTSSADDARTAARAGDSSWVVVVDEDHRPLGWADTARLPKNGRVTDTALLGITDELEDTTSLVDAFDHLVRSPSRMAVRLTDDGALRGVVTSASINAGLPRLVGG